MPIRSIDDLVASPAIASVGTILAMGWSKLTSRRSRPFEPTLWFVFRWVFILVTIGGYIAGEADDLSAVHRSYRVLFAISATIVALVVFGSAVLDWRRATRTEQLQRSK